MKYLFCFVLVCLPSVLLAGDESRLNLDDVTQELILEIDLDRPGMESVKDATSPTEARIALLEYFRQRDIPKLLTKTPEQMKGKPLSKRDQEWADGALKHYFVGQRSYPLQYRGEDIDWDSNPFADLEWIWQLHRFYWWHPMGNAYWSTGDERYAEQWVEEVNSWIHHMHQPQNFEKHPGWRALETGGRLELMPKAMEYFIHSPSMDADTLTLYLWSMQKHVKSMVPRYSGNPELGKINNHYMHQLAGVLTYSLYFPEYKENKALSADTIDRIIKAQEFVLLPDGVINELVTSYHTGYPGQFLGSIALCEKFGLEISFPQSYYDRIEKAISAVMLWSHPDGTFPQFGDAWEKTPGSGQGFVGKFLKDFDRPDWNYFSSKGKTGVAPTELVHMLPDAGYYTMRSGWDEGAVFLVAKNSKVGSMFFHHNHLDNMTFELSAYGEKLMADSGCYSYFGTPEWRTWFRQPFAHQMVALDNQPVRSRGELVFQFEGDGIAVTSLQNQSYPDMLHRRTFVMVDKKYFLILDDLSGEASGQLSQNFQFLPGIAVFDQSGLSAKTMNEAGPNLIVESMQSEGEGVSLSEREGWISSEYMKKSVRPAFAFLQEKSANENASFLTALIPTPEDRKIFALEFGFLKDGLPSKEVSNQIFLQVNKSEMYTITLDFENEEASVVKEVEPYNEAKWHTAEYLKDK